MTNATNNQLTIDINGSMQYTTGPEYDARVERIVESTIVCFSREDAEEVASEIRAWGVAAQPIGRSVRGEF
jgi:hypothetical protein